MWAKIDLTCRIQALDKFFYIMYCFLWLLLFQKQINILHMMSKIMAHGFGG